MKFNTGILLLGTAAISSASAIPDPDALASNSTELDPRSHRCGSAGGGACNHEPDPVQKTVPAPGCTKDDDGVYWAWTTCEIVDTQPWYSTETKKNGRMVPGPWKSSAHMPWCWLTSDQDNRRSCDEEGTPPNLNDPEVEFWCLNIDIDGAQNDKGKHGGCFVDG